MKIWFTLFLAVVSFVSSAPAQADDPLAVTLPSGKIIHFQTAEQKAKYESALRARVQNIAQPASAASTPAKATPAPMPQPRSSSGPRVNTNAPTFTADYYLIDAEGWLFRQITLSVAFVTLRDDVDRDDGYRQLSAYTYGVIGGAGGQDSGGYLTILAKPAAAMRLVQQCGTNLAYNNGNVKVTMIKGELTVLETVKGENTGRKTYGFLIEK